MLGNMFVEKLVKHEEKNSHFYYIELLFNYLANSHSMLEKVMKRKRRQIRVRASIIGTATKPRLSVFRSNASIYAQMIDDTAAKTLCASSDMKILIGTKRARATEVGQDLAKKALALGITSCVFDR
jgi:large subunit ribosomal protein L18